MSTVQQPLPPTSPAPVQQTSAPPLLPETNLMPELIIYSHSNFFYWWPVWAVGFLMAVLTRVQGELVTIGESQAWFHPSKSLGVIYTGVFLLVIIFTNVTLRGKTSVIVVLSLLFITVLFAYLGWWDYILNLLPYLAIHMNLGFYMTFSILLLGVWLISVFVYDRLRYWRIRPGQLTEEVVIGGAARSFDTRGMVFEKRAEDFFRHWILGLGSGDIRIVTSGGHQSELVLTNVLFVDRKVQQIQELIAVKPETLGTPVAAS